MTRWARTLPTIATVIDLVEHHYGLVATDVVLVRSFNNDVYRVTTDERSYALKIYGLGRFTADEVRWEQALARHLVDAGQQVAADVRLVDGDTVGMLTAPEGARPFALTEWVPGAKPAPPWTDELFRTVGASLARFHDAAGTFVTSQPRRERRADEELDQILAVLRHDPDRQDLVRVTAEAAARELGAVAADLQLGIRHGDPSLDNVHIHHGGVYFYDLDLASSGWLAEDLTGATSTDFADVFLAGYASVRPLPETDLHALPWLRIRATISNLYFHLIVKPSFQGSSTLAEGWVDENFADLERFARKIGLFA
jgi:Ser/Thr protein kinase RdoA (MazF antagonist)